MVKLIILCTFASFFNMVLSYNGQRAGIWSLIDIDKCETVTDNVLLSFDIVSRKVNRTHVAFTTVVDAMMDIDDTFGLYINVCKYMDGGCKHYTDIVDGMEKLVNKVAKDNVENAFRLAGIDPPRFPIPEGRHVVENFVMDYCELPTNSPFAKYEAEMFVTKDNERVGCVKAVVEIMEMEEEAC